MHLYLSSFRMGDRFQDLLDLAGPGARTAVISNAVDFIDLEDRRAYAAKVHDPAADFRQAGLDAFDLDLRDHFGRPESLAAALVGIRLVWCVGGNAFLLRRALRQSGFEAAIAGRADLIYGGWSAGACVAGSTLRGLELMDDPDLVVDGYAPAPVWEGLGLVDYAIVPHFESDHPEADAAARAHHYMTREGIPHRTLRDGDVIVSETAT